MATASVGGFSGWQLYLIIAMFFLLIIIGMVVAFIILSRRRWKFNVVIVENLAGKGSMITGRDKARLISFGDGGEEIFLLKKRKKYKVGYGKRLDKNQIGFAIGQDGYWYNFNLGDIDSKLLEVGVVPVDRDMRYATASVRKGIENRYNEKTFYEKYGLAIALGILVLFALIQGGLEWYNAKKQVEIAQTNLETAKVSKEIAEVNKETLANVATIKQIGTSGIAPASK